jgi:hypothetical protein
MGRKYPHSSTIGTKLGKIGVVEKLKGENLRAKWIPWPSTSWMSGVANGFFLHGVSR